MDPTPSMDVGIEEVQASSRNLEKFLNADPIVDLAPLMALDSHPDPNLRKAIRNKIKSWRRSIQEPPFTEEQLVVMALADEGKPMTGKAIYCWIMARLPYYLNLASEYLWRRGALHGDLSLCAPIFFSDGGLAGKAHDFKKRFNEAFVQFEVPLTESTLPDDALIPPPVKTHSDNTQWTVATAEAKVYLRSLLQDVPRKEDDCFPFLRLPYELRLRIYEMVFAFPRAGVRLYRREDPHEFPAQPREMEMVSITRDLHDLEAKKRWFVRADSRHEVFGSLNCQPLSQLLSMFLVCRKIYEEAMPVFFDINTFVFLSVDEMYDFLQPLPNERRKHVRTIRVEFLLDLFDGLNGFGYMNTSLKPQQHKHQAEILKTCTGLADIEIIVRDYRGRLSFDEEAMNWDKQIHQSLAIFAPLECCHIRFGDKRPTKWETRLARYREQLRIGHDMICS